MSENQNNETDNRLEVEINDGRKMKIDSVRVNGDVFDADGNLLEKGRFIELTAAQVAAFGQANIQPFANAYFNINQNQE